MNDKLVLASVSDKTGLACFAERLEKAGFSFLASGGTAAALKKAGVSVTEVSEYTGSPEILGGRVKTLHPFIHGGILARPTEDDGNEIEKLGIKNIAIVIANLYPFEKTISDKGCSHGDCIENIDIGGVALLRAAAKNYEKVLVLCDPADYEAAAAEIEENGCTSLETRKRMAVKAFAVCTRYDAAITSWLEPSAGEYIFGFAGQPLRYGENPHQSACLYTNCPSGGVLGGKVLQGKALSYNNILDADAAWSAVSAFEKPAAVVVKHLTPCGIAEAGKEGCLSLALKSAIICDSVSAFGGIIAVNGTFDKACFEALDGLFAECIIAPEFSEEAKALLEKKKNCRLIEAPAPVSSEVFEFKSVLGGFLKEERDLGDPDGTEFKNAALRKADEKELLLLRFAWKACRTVKSNAILLASFIDPAAPEKGICTVGIGCGQPNRVDAARQAAERAGAKAKGAVLASDAFFPFPDTMETAAAAGITAIVQPGGSLRDNLSIEECNKHNMAMVFTGVRHFKH